MGQWYQAPDNRRFWIENGLIYGADVEVASWINMMLGGGPLEKVLFVAIGALKQGVSEKDVTIDSLPQQLVAGAYFYDEVNEDGYSDIKWSVYADDINASTPDVLRRVLDYPFRQRGLRRITAEIDLANERAVRQAQKLGFVLEGKKRDMAPNGGDVGVFGLLPANCPILKAA